jgi:hypothetical protein
MMCPLILANLAADVSEEDEVGEGDGMAELKASTERAVYRVFALRVEHCISQATFTRTPQYQFSPIIRPSVKLNKLPY